MTTATDCTTRERNATMIEMLEASAEGMEDMLLRTPPNFAYRSEVRGWVRVARSAVALLKEDAEGWFGSALSPNRPARGDSP